MTVITVADDHKCEPQLEQLGTLLNRIHHLVEKCKKGKLNVEGVITSVQHIADGMMIVEDMFDDGSEWTAQAKEASTLESLLIPQVEMDYLTSFGEARHKATLARISPARAAGTICSRKVGRKLPTRSSYLWQFLLCGDMKGNHVPVKSIVSEASVALSPLDLKWFIEKNHFGERRALNDNGNTHALIDLGDGELVMITIVLTASGTVKMYLADWDWGIIHRGERVLWRKEKF